MLKNSKSRIKLIAMDVDGTLTECNPHCDFTGRASEIVLRRAEELSITEVHQGARDKTAVLESVASKYGLTLAETAFIGDDEDDLDAMYNGFCVRQNGSSTCSFYKREEVYDKESCH
jgi:3-deoxy-D-manno-octulosonate 8-phosphate phosphatase KdsC-like HAD superfamily phosphatase